MVERLFIGVLGHRNAGKSTTWNTLFGATVRTGQYARRLELRPGECVDVFLVSGSPEERGLYAGDILKNQAARIVLCSMQYTAAVQDTLDYVTEIGFDLRVQWLNPGHQDTGNYFDRLGLASRILGEKGSVAIRDGKLPPAPRVQELREQIYGWALYRGLIFAC